MVIPEGPAQTPEQGLPASPRTIIACQLAKYMATES